MSTVVERKVLMIAYPYAPLAAAGSFRCMRFVKYLREFGWDPLVLTVCPDNLPQAVDRSLYDCVPDDVVVRRVRSCRPLRSLVQSLKRLGASVVSVRKAGADDPTSCHSSNSAQRGGKLSSLLRFLHDVHEFVFDTPDRENVWILPALIAAISLNRQHRPRVIYSTGPPHSGHLIAVLLKLITRLPVVLDFRDPWARMPGRVRRGGAMRQGLQNRLERFCVKKSDRVILNTDTMRSDFVAAYPEEPKEKFTTIPNGYDPDLSFRKQADEDTVASETRAISLCHPGEIYGQRDLRPVVAAMHQLREAGLSVQLEQIGNVDNSCSLQAQITSLGLQNAAFLRGQLPYDETIRHMQDADVFLLPQPGTSLQIPSKVFEMLPFGKPILALTEPGSATAQVVMNYNLGAVAAPLAPQEIADAIVDLSARRGVSNDGWQEAMREFDGRMLTQKLSDLLNRVDHARASL